MTSLPVETQLAVLVNEIRHQRNMIASVERDVDECTRSVTHEVETVRIDLLDRLKVVLEQLDALRRVWWTLAISIAGSAILFALTNFAFE